MYWSSKHIKIILFSNSGFAGCLDSKRSISSYVFMLVEGVLCHGKGSNKCLQLLLPWKQDLLLCYEAFNQATWLQNLIIGLQFVDSIENTLNIYCDNKPVKLYLKTTDVVQNLST